MHNTAYGFWSSAISAEMVAQNSEACSQLKVHKNTVYYCEQRAAEKGRVTILSCDNQGLISECLPKEYSARSRVHEYGGGDFAVGDTGMYFVNDADQAIYCISNKNVLRITELNNHSRYADLQLSPDENYLVCVRERHENSVINDLICIDLASLHIEILVSGADFYMSPVFCENSKKIAWLQWNLPQMPWDGTELYSADFTEGQVKNLQKIAGGDKESIYQPSFHNNKLYYVSDKTGWWNIYCEGKNIASMEAECGYPAWVFGTNSYAFLNNAIILLVTEQGLQKIAILENNSLRYLETGYESISPYIALANAYIYFFGGNPQEKLALRKLAINEKSTKTFEKSNAISQAQPIEFPTTEGDHAYAFYYAPCNVNFSAPENTKPPLLVMSHGGPTAATSTDLDAKIQFWTSRGFAVMDVNYRGSSGYGRAYREKLYKNWGKYDVEDCIKAVEYGIDHDLCDPHYIFIRGKSASGLTALLCLATSRLFAGAAIYYGVTDLSALLNDTHKFESRYTDLLIGRYPEAKAIFEERSAINHAEKIKAPVIFFQGLRDKVVLPSQAEMMIGALRKNKILVDYRTFENEGHGFRDAKNMIEALEQELAFYQGIMQA